jgi:hypothetical protein
MNRQGTSSALTDLIVKRRLPIKVQRPFSMANVRYRSAVIQTSTVREKLFESVRLSRVQFESVHTHCTGRIDQLNREGYVFSL